MAALEISVNGGAPLLLDWPDRNLQTYQVATDLGLQNGISLLEFLPLMLSCDRLTAHTPTGNVTLEGDNLAESFVSSFFLPLDEGGWDLSFSGEIIHGVELLEFRAELLDSRELDVWLSWEGVPELKKEIEQFARLHDCRIKAIDVPNIRSKLFTVLRGGGRVPDIVMIQSDYLPNFADSRLLQPAFVGNHPGISEKGWQAFTIDNQIWAVPLYLDTQLLFFNRDALLLDAPGLSTLSDIEKSAALLAKAGWIPMAWNAYSAYWLVPFLYAFGKAELIENNGSIRIDDAATRESVQYLIDLHNLNYLSFLERDAMIRLFADGKVAMILSGSYSIPRFEKMGIPFAVLPLPINDRTNLPLSPILDYKGLAIPRKSRNPVLARRLIQYLTGIGVQQRFSRHFSKLPANEDSWAVVRPNNQYFAILESSYRQGKSVPPSKAYLSFKNTMWKLLRLALTGAIPVAEAMEKGQQILNSNGGT